ncbi:MAG: 16S rRNA (cytidine(1402)-2'-O)-methyltransferase [Bacilli bacterium]
MKRNKSFNNKEPLLYLLSTPIGNLSDISLRAKEILSSCDLIAAEDTRNTNFLLDRIGINKPIISLHEHNEVKASLSLINKIKEENINVVYVSDAGYPGISDPGHILVEKCIENNIKVSVIPGPSAFLSALVASNIDTNHFVFYGFLDARTNKARSELNKLKDYEHTLIFYESPHRIEKTINLFYEVLGDRKFTLARELTKLNEEYIYGTLSELVNIDFSSLKGEIVIVIEGKKEEKEQSSIDNEEIKLIIKKLLKENKTKTEITSLLIEQYKISKKVIYNLFSLIDKE